MNYQLTEHGLVTSDPVISAMSLGKYDSKTGEQIEGVAETSWYRFFDNGDVDYMNYPITIPYVAIAEAIKPVEGEAFYGWDKDWNSENAPKYSLDYGANDHWNMEVVVNANPITTGKTVGELRELIAKIAGESQEG